MGHIRRRRRRLCGKGGGGGGVRWRRRRRPLEEEPAASGSHGVSVGGDGTRVAEKKKLEQGGTPLDPSKIKEKDKGVILRPFNIKDLKEAKNQVVASFAAEGSIMGELKQWNELYGEGGSRKKEQLTYFL
ncbi:hypothetical protein BRADI_2g07920v3 [Brachypodium distachyon]|uniref:Uncharacterized protein n=1 Tax=Brachypodium distachyon TaxID=15368 RepID=I1HDL7_BRADI|nr:hypothetical protein BRADI_2g07920v3 [Brachypodium distachyon]